MKDKWRVIELTQGYVAVISEKDYERVSQYKWHAHMSAGKHRKIGQPYARGVIDGKKVYMHRFIMEASPKVHIDHRNFCTLDNRRENLRALPPKKNQRRRRNCKN